jgi:hypothetical protein
VDVEPCVYFKQPWFEGGVKEYVKSIELEAMFIVDDCLLDALHGLDDNLLHLEECISDFILAESVKGS